MLKVCHQMCLRMFPFYSGRIEVNYYDQITYIYKCLKKKFGDNP